MKLKQQVAIIIGGAGSIGQAVAHRMVREGAAVAVCDIQPELVEQAAAQISENGGEALAIQLDVRSTQNIASMTEAVLARFGRIDIMVYTAGGSARSQIAPLHRAEEEVIDRILDVNLRGAIYCSRAVLPRMMEQKRGKIIHIGSIVGMNGKAALADYSAAKAGVIALTKTLALEAGPYGINVNCVSPGLVPRENEKSNLERVMRTNVLNRVCAPEDIANMVNFLASDEADFITGQNFVVDGGRSLGLKGD